MKGTSTPGDPYSQVRRVKLLRIIGGFLLVLLGIVGLIMPIMPGWIFLIPGLMILGERFAWAKRLAEWAKRKAKGTAANVI